MQSKMIETLGAKIRENFGKSNRPKGGRRRRQGRGGVCLSGCRRVRACAFGVRVCVCCVFVCV